MIATAIGGDPALRHGVFVLATWDLGPNPKLLDYVILYKWTKKDPHLSEEATLSGIQRACQTIVKACVNPAAPHPVGIDWTSTTGFMGRRKTASVLSFFIGYLTREFEVYGYPVIIIKPAEVREAFGYNNHAPKETIWGELKSMLTPEQMRMKKDIASDLRDALILSYLTAVGRNRNEARKGQPSNLSSR